MPSRLLLPLVAAAATLGAASVAPGQGFFRRFIPVDRVEADADADYTLSQEDGPWLIMAATFSGEGARRQAHELAVELRQRLNAKAYVHDLRIDLPTENVGLGVDKLGAPVKMKYRKGASIHEWAVLVGDFRSVDDPEAQRMLKVVKAFEPQALRVEEGEQTYQTLADVRQHQERFVPRLASSERMGPMRTAFVTRNPILPKEYFVPKGVDKFVEKMNRGVKHSLLDCEGRYTIKVATFGGSGELQTASLSRRGRRNNRDSDPLIEAFEDAHLLTEELRANDWEAFEFHDRHESYVTIGSFDKVTQELADGRVVPTAEVRRIIETFGAAYNTPQDPLQQARLPQHVHAQARQRQVQARQLLARQNAPVAGGLNPKFARVPPDSKNARVITFDIHPHAIEAPKRTVSGSFAWW